MHVLIFWTGQFGNALASLVRSNWHTLTTWSYRHGTPLAELPHADAYISTLTGAGLEKVAWEIREEIGDTPLLSATKAYIHGEDLHAIFPSSHLGKNISVLSWPNLASEMLLGLPTGATFWRAREHFDLVQKILETPLFELEYTSDARMIEVMGIMKNIIAIGIGMIDGYGLGENLKGIFIARMCRDIGYFSRESLGCDFDITSLFAGVGDLFTTCASTESRNHGFWVYFARTGSTETALEFMNTTVEWLWSIGILAPLLPRKYTFLHAFLWLFSREKNIEKSEFLEIFQRNR